MIPFDFVLALLLEPHPDPAPAGPCESTPGARLEFGDAGPKKLHPVEVDPDRKSHRTGTGVSHPSLKYLQAAAAGARMKPPAAES